MSENTTDHMLDTSGLQCPLPVLKARKAIQSLDSGAILVVIATDPASYIDFNHFCHESGNTLLAHSEDDGVFTYRIQKA
ncbi:sulfurtransferase TusA family protein [Sneathiella chinensis]|uniref:Response regulator SirA n=1 Tax=Sneathiella chinensis TaxID=349750 RepID=A0ABQ5U2Q5_9PROT|nr:sulfurtransferase TusA family protein [Sneathiella chinensis]GLQ06367.1 response regulator SirA [Sneathiella chinensis]